MNNNVVGINEDKINCLILEIYDYAENIKKILNEIDSLVSENIQYFDLGFKNEFLSIHDGLKSNFPIVTQNILSYATDLMNVKKKYSISIDNISSDLNKINQFKG